MIKKGKEKQTKSGMVPAHDKKHMKEIVESTFFVVTHSAKRFVCHDF